MGTLLVLSVALASLLFFIVGWPLLDIADGPSVTFVAIGDWGRVGDTTADAHARRKGAERQLDLVPVLSRIAQRERVQFVVSTGDNF